MSASVDMQVVKVYSNKEVQLAHDNKYCEVQVHVADLELDAYVLCDKVLEKGQYIRVHSFTLRNAYADFYNVAIAIKEFEVIPEEDYQPAKYLMVSVEGVLKKPEGRSPKMVGEKGNEKLFYSCAIKCRNESNKHFFVLVVGMFTSAEQLYNVQEDEVIRIRGRLKRCRNSKGFEINVSRINKKGRCKE